jgi:hypothetical protein
MSERLRVLTVMCMKITVVWDVTPYNLAERYEIPPKRRYIYTKLHSVTSYKIVDFFVLTHLAFVF